jgi:UDP-N-acetylglucosamine 1-carboxyvinyltransferase
MEMFVIEGGHSLKGEVAVSGSKNCSLPILTATLLCERPSRISNVPYLADTGFLLSLMESFGVSQKRDENNDVLIDARSITSTVASYEMVRKMRASVLVLAPLLARAGEAKVSLPGGCAIGSRPVDLHLMGLKKLGADLKVQDGYIHATLKNSSFIGADIELPLPSVGATEQIIMAAVLAKGVTNLFGAAKEPEVVDFCKALISAGAKITGHGTSHVVIDGVSSLGSMVYQVAPDRIEAGTLIAAAAATASTITIKNVCVDDMASVIHHFEKAGCLFKSSPELGENSELMVIAPKRLTATNMETAAHPGFPTDMQAQFMAAMTVAQGTSVIYERIFENRMMHVPELNRLGARIELHRGVATVVGQESLLAAPVMATDLRASASLIIAALAAQGQSEVRRIYHLDRGYEALDKKLTKLGASLTRCTQT